MPEMLAIYEPGDRFATMSGFGQARIYQIDNDGLPVDLNSQPMAVDDANVIEQRLDPDSPSVPKERRLGAGRPQGLK